MFTTSTARMGLAREILDNSLLLGLGHLCYSGQL